MLHMAFPTGAVFLVNNHQELPYLLGALRACDAKPLHFHVGPKKVVGMEAIVQRLRSQTLPTLFVQLLKAQTWVAHLFGAFQIDPQNSCATDSPIHPASVVFFQTHFPTDVSIGRVFLSHALSSNGHTGIRECHVHHTTGKGKG